MSNYVNSHYNWSADNSQIHEIYNELLKLLRPSLEKRSKESRTIEHEEIDQLIKTKYDQFKGINFPIQQDLSSQIRSLYLSSPIRSNQELIDEYRLFLNKIQNYDSRISVRTEINYFSEINGVIINEAILKEIFDNNKGIGPINSQKVSFQLTQETEKIVKKISEFSELTKRFLMLFDCFSKNGVEVVELWINNHWFFIKENYSDEERISLINDLNSLKNWFSFRDLKIDLKDEYKQSLFYFLFIHGQDFIKNYTNSIYDLCEIFNYQDIKEDIEKDATSYMDN